jgi:ADP-dependent NAD(P)H-hydrate dehydratase / NAD(P)H-hydrate epimerase
MIKVLSAPQLKEADAYTINNEPISGVALMERAATKASEWILEYYKNSTGTFHIVCGPGNNGGDGLVIARKLKKSEKKVQVYLFDDNEQHSEEYLYHLKLLRESVTPIILNDTIQLKTEKEDIIIDAIFGTGLSRPASGIFETTIKVINSLRNPVISIDVPSGMFADEPSTGKIIAALHTLTFQFPKLAFLFPETGMLAGKIEVLDIGLHQGYWEKLPVKNMLPELKDIQPLILKRQAFSHKGTYGHALIIAGTKGKTGAAILSASACIHSGAGMVTTLLPACSENAMNASVPEIMTITEGDLYISSLPDISNYSTVGCGPGLGMEDDTARMLKMLIQNCRSPIVLDADALNILAENKTWLSFLPPGCILTPHPGEFARLTEKTTNGFERLKLQLEFSKKYSCYLILKDHFTCITTPDGTAYFNSTGNAGMATAGSGDVLTGIITSLLAQGYNPFHASIAGVYLHGLSGDLAAAENSMESLTAGSIIQFLGKAFQLLHKGE